MARGAARGAHAEGDRGLVQRLVRSNGHPDLVAHTQQQQAALGAVDRDLADQLIEALGVQLLAHGAYPGLARLPLQQALVELLLQVDHVEPGGWCAGDVLHPELPLVRPLTARRGRGWETQCAREERAYNRGNGQRLRGQPAQGGAASGAGRACSSKAVGSVRRRARCAQQAAGGRRQAGRWCLREGAMRTAGARSS